MAITPPNYQRDAVPTNRGWTHPRTGELLVSRPIKQHEIDEYLGVDPMHHQHPDGTSHSHEGGDQPHTHELNEAPSHGSLDDMSKKELEALGRQHGIELDRRKNKDDLIEELNEAIKD